MVVLVNFKRERGLVRLDTPNAASIFSFIGEHLSLDFTNTVGSRLSNPLEKPQRDYFHGYGDLVEWSRQAGTVSAEVAQQLLARAEQLPAEAEQVFRRAVILREAIYNIFVAILKKEAINANNLAILNSNLTEALAHLEIAVIDGDGIAGDFEWEWRESQPPQFERVVWPIARAAGDLLVAADKRKVKFCASETCGWLFIDSSKNHSRQWCDMNDCGNRAKAHRHYQRKRSSN